MLFPVAGATSGETDYAERVGNIDVAAVREALCQAAHFMLTNFSRSIRATAPQSATPPQSGV
jgi:hypothetical protein